MSTRANQAFNDQIFYGTVKFEGAVSFGNASIGDSAIAADADIAASKLMHQHRHVFAQNSNSNAAAQTVTIFVANAAGSINTLDAGAIVVAIGAATATVDLKKNGTSVLTSPVTLNNSQTSRQLLSASVSSANYVAGDVFEIVITATAGGGTLAQGIFAYLDVTESFA